MVGLFCRVMEPPVWFLSQLIALHLFYKRVRKHWASILWQLYLMYFLIMRPIMLLLKKGDGGFAGDIFIVSPFWILVVIPFFSV